jgi:phage terminase large subunit GpA-like protein
MHEERFSERGIIPAGTVAVTLGCDSQSDGFFWLLCAWGRRMQCWLPLTDRIVGDMRSDETWKALLSVLTTTWLDKDGNGYKPVISALDVQGDSYPECLEFVRANGFRCRLKAVRGYAPHQSQSYGRTYGILRNRYLDKTTGVTVHTLDVNIAKSQLATMLARTQPGPGFVNIPCGPNGEDKGGWTQEATEELNAEYQRPQNVRGYTVTRWYKKSGQANHRLDCLVYALAALSISRLKIDDCEIQRTEARNVGKQEEQSNKPSAFGAHKIVGYPADLTVPTIMPLPKPHSGFGALPGSRIS